MRVCVCWGLGSRDALKQRGLVPLIIGAPTSPEYAQRCIGKHLSSGMLAAAGHTQDYSECRWLCACVPEALKDAFPGEASEVREFGASTPLARSTLSCGLTVCARVNCIQEGQRSLQRCGKKHFSTYTLRCMRLTVRVTNRGHFS